MNSPPTSRLALLDQQRAAGFAWLRFRPELEGEYRVDHADEIVARRMALLVTAVVLIAITPLLEAAFMHPPPAFVPYARLAQFGFMIPSIVLAGVFTLWRPLRRWGDVVAVFTTCVVCAGVIYQRHAGAAYGYLVPSELVAVTLTGAAVMASLRTALFAPGVLLILGLAGWSEMDAFGGTSQTHYVVFAQSMFGIIAILGTAMEEYAARKSWLQRKMLEELTLRDPLTGLVNGRGLQDVYRRLYSTAMREHRPMLVIAVDIDHFKAFNDHYGHLAGDDCLRRIANVLSRHGRRGNDIAARTGGEEFVLVWYDVVPDHAERLLETLRQDVERLGILHAGVPDRPGVVTVSIGAICAVPGPRVAPEALMQVADEQLYVSKQRGRNCVSLRSLDAPVAPPSERTALPS